METLCDPVSANLCPDLARGEKETLLHPSRLIIKVLPSICHQRHTGLVTDDGQNLTLGTLTFAICPGDYHPVLFIPFDTSERTAGEVFYVSVWICLDDVRVKEDPEKMFLLAKLSYGLGDVPGSGSQLRLTGPLVKHNIGYNFCYIYCCVDPLKILPSCGWDGSGTYAWLRLGGSLSRVLTITNCKMLIINLQLAHNILVSNSNSFFFNQCLTILVLPSRLTSLAYMYKELITNVHVDSNPGSIFSSVEYKRIATNYNDVGIDSDIESSPGPKCLPFVQDLLRAITTFTVNLPTSQLNDELNVYKNLHYVSKLQPLSMCYSYDTSFLCLKKVVIDGDFESNPGPISSVEGYRAAIGRFNAKCKIGD